MNQAPQTLKPCNVILSRTHETYGVYQDNAVIYALDRNDALTFLSKVYRKRAKVSSARMERVKKPLDTIETL